MRPHRLFSYVDESRLLTGLYPSFLALLSGFNPQLGVEDDPLDAEIDDFLDTLLTTEVMVIAHGCLVEWGETIFFCLIFSKCSGELITILASTLICIIIYDIICFFCVKCACLFFD